MTQVAAGVQVTCSEAEARLRLIVESAPVSLLIAGPDGRILAANWAALTLLGAERLDQVVGGGLHKLVAPEDRERVLALADRACRGEPGSLEYDVVVPDGTRRTLETHVVPLRREGFAPAVFLGATWDVSERKRLAAALQQSEARYEVLRAQHVAECEVSKEALRQAETAYDELSRGRAAERQALEEVLADADERARELAETMIGERDRLQVALSEAARRHERAADEWARERQVLTTRLREAEEREAVLSTELLADQNAGRAMVEGADSGVQAARAERAAESQCLETALSDMLAQHAEFRAVCERLAAVARVLERRCVQRAADRDCRPLPVDGPGPPDVAPPPAPARPERHRPARRLNPGKRASKRASRRRT